MKDVKPIFKDHTGRWREQNPKKDQKFFCDSWNQVAKCAPGQNCDCREYEQFEQSIQYHEFPNPPEVKPGEVVLAYLQWQYEVHGTWFNTTDPNLVEWPVRQIWTLTDKQNENSIQCDGSIKDFILELDWLTTKEFCEKYNIETPSWKGSVELAASEFLNIDAIKWNMVKDFAKKQKLPIAQIKSSEITIGKFIELNGHQPFEEYDSLSNVIQHAACFWKTDMHNWTLLLEEINKLCLKLTYFTPSPEASRGNDVRGKDANIKSIDMSDVPKTPVDSYYKELGNRAITDSGVSAEEAAEKYFKSQKLAGSPFDGFIAGYKEATLKLQSVLQDKEQQINDLISLNDQITETYTNQLSDKDKEIAGLKQALQLIEEKSDYIGVKEPSFREINELASNALKEKP